MMKVPLLKHEEIISQSKSNLIALTNFRVYYSDIKFGKSYTSSILLKNISSIETSYKSNLILLFLALIIGGYLIISSQIILGLVFILIMLLVYFFTRNHFLVISSKGGAKMNLLVKKMENNKVLEFLNKIDQAIIDIELEKKLT